jgi:hypothetical protein
MLKAVQQYLYPSHSLKQSPTLLAEGRKSNEVMNLLEHLLETIYQSHPVTGFQYQTVQILVRRPLAYVHQGHCLCCNVQPPILQYTANATWKMTEQYRFPSCSALSTTGTSGNYFNDHTGGQIESHRGVMKA